MSSEPTSDRHAKRAEMIGLVSVGLLMLGLALFFDPIGDDPETGVIELSKTQAKWLLGTFGASFIFGAIVVHFRSRGKR